MALPMKKLLSYAKDFLELELEQHEEDHIEGEDCEQCSEYAVDLQLIKQEQQRRGN